ncbi:uncharacterized protein [Onthophagus taurus]|uniref:uncharacterized protein n=1 Tax=Onthophagus taurus TaxID=166361 RepID=UPI0039BEAE0E
MYLSIAFSVLCCVLFAKAAPSIENNSSMHKLFAKTMASYEKYIKSPQPSHILISSRDLPEIKEINARGVTPQGVVVQRCPEKIGFDGNERRCKASDFQEEQMVVEVNLARGRVMKTVLVKHETSCAC